MRITKLDIDGYGVWSGLRIQGLADAMNVFYGPNEAGKTTLFRMIAGQEAPDEGQVSVDRGVTIGYFSQDVGEMSGRSAVAEVMDGAGPVSALGIGRDAFGESLCRGRSGIGPLTLQRIRPYLGPLPGK